MKATSQALQARGIVEPTLVLDEAQAVRNIERMVGKARAAGVALRPHFKTHQSAAVGELFRARGVRAITVSSLPMASYFAAHGWDDIGVAIPVNVRALATINELAQRVRLTLLVESVAAVAALAAGLAQEVALWLEIDPGYGCSGVAYDAPAEALAVAQAIVAAPHCRFAGLLAHAGQSYAARTPAGMLRTISVEDHGGKTIETTRAAPAPMTSAAARYAVEPPPPIIKPKSEQPAPAPATPTADQIFTF